MKFIENERRERVYLSLAFVVIARVILSLYWVSRYGQFWIEGDTSISVLTVSNVMESGKIIPDEGVVYVNGFLNQVVNAFIINFTSVDIMGLQQLFAVIVPIFLTIVLFSFYYNILGSSIYAGFATLLVNLQADFIFSSSRGTHEKFLYSFIICSLYVISSTTLRNRSDSWKIKHIFIYYLFLFTLSTINVYFAATFMATLIIGFLVWLVLVKIMKVEEQGGYRIFYISVSTLIMIYFVVFLFYPPSQFMLRVSESLFERLRLFLINFQEPSFDIFEQVNQDWIFPQAWLIFRIYDLALLLLASIGWIYLIIAKIKNKVTGMEENSIWLISIFSGFAFQNIAAIVIDVLGEKFGLNNLQVRLMPLTTLFAAPLAVLIIALIIRRLLQSFSVIYWKKAIQFGAVVIFSLISLMTVIKSTAEPVFSNNWMFYSPYELEGIRWINQNLKNLELDIEMQNKVWSGPYYRMGQLWLLDIHNVSSFSTPFMQRRATNQYQYIFLSPETVVLTNRTNEQIPDITFSNRIYDNGEVQLHSIIQLEGLGGEN